MRVALWAWRCRMSDDAERRSRVSGAARRSADEAAERVAAARERLHAARLSAGDAHERAAQLHDRAAGGGFGDVEAHHRSAERHRAARDADYLAAEQDQ
ncbi:hypothetical protein O973_07360 [Mycobacterium avium subsp. avium 11-4751]|uniref:DUF4398 domain-containing protein n=3 Tax=Mycobacterium TaxID=1763 RepID=A0ABX3TSU3_9MYCO|nr:hypothetical protein O973_07360 [Mycobacterium avium subsp. avium 11-4751]ETB33590.1 hypothetical protein O977_08220 [Mycobacterium avium subsp. paratuberculosis 10-5975]ORA56254.1 hypothetical protein BST19_05120 [Mycobacterium bouchedurhonense]ORB81882.1 hypothetical protein BST46_00930 [Mycobacterium timonense]